MLYCISRYGHFLRAFLVTIKRPSVIPVIPLTVLYYERGRSPPTVAAQQAVINARRHLSVEGLYRRSESDQKLRQTRIFWAKMTAPPFFLSSAVPQKPGAGTIEN